VPSRALFQVTWTSKLASPSQYVTARNVSSQHVGSAAAVPALLPFPVGNTSSYTAGWNLRACSRNYGVLPLAVSS